MLYFSRQWEATIEEDWNSSPVVETAPAVTKFVKNDEIH